MLSVLPLIAILAAPAASPLEGCTAEPNEGGWIYSCAPRELSASVRDGAGEPMDRRTLEILGGSTARAAHASAGEPRWERRSLGGEDVDVLWVDHAVQHFGFVSLRRPEGARLVVCSSATPSGCDEVLEVLAASPWRSGPVPGTKRKAVQAATLLGRPVELPPDCSGQTSDDGYTTVRCGTSGMADWFFAPDGSDPDAKMKETEDALVQLERGTPKVRKDAFACTLAGREATCRRQVVTTPRTTGTYVWTWVPVSGRRLVASCTGDDVSAPPCSIALGIDDAPGRKLSLAGLQVRVPDSCRVERDYPSVRIVCGVNSAFVSWSVARNDAAAEAALEERDEYLAGKVRRLDPKARFDRVPCRIGGTACTCRRARFETPAGTSTYLGAAARVEGSAVWAFCVAPGDSDAVPCSVVFELD